MKFVHENGYEKSNPVHWKLSYLLRKYFDKLSPHPPITVSLTTMNKTLLLCAGFLWNDLAQVCSLNVLQWSSATIWSYNNWMFTRGEISWQVIFPPQQYHLQLFPYIQCHWEVCPSERLSMVCFHFQHSNFHLEVKVRLNHVLVKYHNIQFHSRFRECFITFLNQMSSWSKRKNGGIFNVSPCFILEQINLLIWRGEVVVRKGTQPLVLACQWHQSAREVKTSGAQSCSCYLGSNPSDAGVFLPEYRSLNCSRIGALFGEGSYLCRISV